MALTPQLLELSIALWPSWQLAEMHSNLPDNRDRRSLVYILKHSLTLDAHICPNFASVHLHRCNSTGVCKRGSSLALHLHLSKPPNEHLVQVQEERGHEQMHEPTLVSTAGPRKAADSQAMVEPSRMYSTPVTASVSAALVRVGESAW